jgi:hypothetical protein
MHEMIEPYKPDDLVYLRTARFDYRKVVELVDVSGDNG